MLILAVDLSKAASTYRLWEIDAVTMILQSCKPNLYSLLGFARHALTILEPVQDPGQARVALESAETLPGTPEPVEAMREALILVQNYYAGAPRGGHTIVIIWSMPKKPRLPLKFLAPMAESLGARLSILSLQYDPPRWTRSEPSLRDLNIVYRRRLRGVQSLRSSACPEGVQTPS